MNRNPNQRKVISLQKLHRLREELCQAYFKCKNEEEELMTPKSKESPYYKELRSDIFKNTKKDISTGTLVKFFNQEKTEKDRRYRIITIETIEEYIMKVLLQGNVKERSTELKGETEHSLLLVTQESPELKEFAKRIYIELTTRKAAILINEDKDVIVEIYDSWYKLFCIIREELKTIPAVYFGDNVEQASIISLSQNLLNETLRPHLTEHQANYRAWLEKAKTNPKNKNISPQELQKRYPDYKNLIESLKRVNENLIKSSKLILTELS